jgi:hypothetical protein
MQWFYLTQYIRSHVEMKCHHLNFVGESYVQHLRFTVYLCAVLFVLSIVALMHGLFPWILTGTVSDKIKHLNERLSSR